MMGLGRSFHCNALCLDWWVSMGAAGIGGPRILWCVGSFSTHGCRPLNAAPARVILTMMIMWQPRNEALCIQNHHPPGGVEHTPRENQWFICSGPIFFCICQKLCNKTSQWFYLCIQQLCTLDDPLPGSSLGARDIVVNEAKDRPGRLPSQSREVPKDICYIKNLKSVPIFDLVLCLEARYGLNVCGTSKFTLKPNPHCDDICRWGLWEVIRSWGWSPHQWN